MRLPTTVALFSTLSLACAGPLPEDALGQSFDATPELTVGESALTTSNGINLPNGLNLPNGTNLGNGIILGNGINLGNGIHLPNGINLSTLIRSGMPAAQFSPPAGSDLEKWISVSPTMRQRTLKYLVECALPAGVTVKLKYKGVLSTLGKGVANLGPGLRNGLMNATEQERVSACILARINARGEVVSLSLVGTMPGFAPTAADFTNFPAPEGAFFGNIFTTTPQAFVCMGSEPSRDACAFRACRQPDGSCNCGAVTVITAGDAETSGLLPTGTYIKSCHDFIDYNPRCDKLLADFTSGSTYNYGYYYTNCKAGGRTWANVISTRTR